MGAICGLCGPNLRDNQQKHHGLGELEGSAGQEPAASPSTAKGGRYSMMSSFFLGEIGTQDCCVLHSHLH